jgi:hypothetical protein
MIDKWFNCTIIGKTTETIGLIFKATVYIVAFKFEDGTTVSKRVPFDQYCSFNVGNKKSIHLYSNDGRFWVFDKEEL